MYMPICLSNTLLKIFTKVLNNRAMLVADKAVDPVQSAFTKGRYILDDVVLLHEILHEIHKSKSSAVLFKVHFEKAYDKVNWLCLEQVLDMKGFPLQFTKMVMQIVKGGSVGITVNDMLGPYFKTRKGLRQGDPRSPILFNLIVDGLNVLLKRAQSQNLITSLVPQLRWKGV